MKFFKVPALLHPLGKWFPVDLKQFCILSSVNKFLYPPDMSDFQSLCCKMMLVISHKKYFDNKHKCVKIHRSVKFLKKYKKYYDKKTVNTGKRK